MGSNISLPIMMNQNIKEKFPTWVNEKLDRHLILSDDLDSLLACTLLNKQFGYEINAYYLFNEGLGLIDSESKKKLIGVDIAMNEQKYCWDNHVTIIDGNTSVNRNSANFNTIFNVSAQNRNSYFKKFAGSTAMQIWSYYGFELPKTDNGKMMLLSIDSAFLGFYDDRFKDTWIYYMEILGFEELIKFCEEHTKKDFLKFKDMYSEHITLADNHIEYDSRKFVEECLEMELYIPTKPITGIAPMTAHSDILWNVGNLSKKKEVFSYAITGVNKVKYTTINQFGRGN